MVMLNIGRVVGEELDSEVAARCRVLTSVSSTWQL
jgi:hypothetical protein